MTKDETMKTTNTETTTNTDTTAHTPEPWEESVNADLQWDVCMEHGGDMIADLALCGPNGEANAKRICACVNACAGLPDPAIVPELVAMLTPIRDLLFGTIGDALTGDQMNDLGVYDAINRVDTILARIGKATP